MLRRPHIGLELPLQLPRACVERAATDLYELLRFLYVCKECSDTDSASRTHQLGASRVLSWPHQVLALVAGCLTVQHLHSVSGRGKLAQPPLLEMLLANCAGKRTKK